MLNFYSINSSAPHATLNLKPTFKSREQLSAVQDYTHLKYAAASAAFLLISTVAYYALSSISLFSKSSASSNNHFGSSSSNNIPASLGYVETFNPITLHHHCSSVSQFNWLNLTTILPIKMPPANFELMTINSISLNLPSIAQIVSSTLHKIPSLPHYLFRLATLSSCEAIANTTAQHNFNQSKNNDLQNSSLQNCKPKFNDSAYIDPDEFNDIQKPQIKNSMLENEVLVSGGIGALTATITYLAAEYFYPALNEISHTVTEKKSTSTLEQDGFEEIWTPSLPNAETYKNFLELLIGIEKSKHQISLIANLNKLVEMIDYILKPEHVQYTQLDTSGQNALRKLFYDYRQAITKAAQTEQTETTRSLAAATFDMLANALSQIISKANQILVGSDTTAALDNLNVVVRKMFTITEQAKFKTVTQLTQLSNKVITQHSRASISQQLAALAFTVSALASYLWLKKAL